MIIMKCCNFEGSFRRDGSWIFCFSQNSETLYLEEYLSMLKYLYKTNSTIKKTYNVPMKELNIKIPVS